MQSNQLQQIEQIIAQGERDAILNMINLREKAAIMKITEFEREKAEKKAAKKERQRVAMAEIQQQLEQKKKVKVA